MQNVNTPIVVAILQSFSECQCDKSRWDKPISLIRPYTGYHIVTSHVIFTQMSVNPENVVNNSLVDYKITYLQRTVKTKQIKNKQKQTG